MLQKSYLEAEFEFVSQLQNVRSQKLPPGGQNLLNFDKDKAIKLSLYENYNEKTTIKGLGFKNKQKAIYTINKIKNKPKNYQVRVITTMMERAKHHPSKTKEMNDAINIFKKWKKEHYRSS